MSPTFHLPEDYAFLSMEQREIALLKAFTAAIATDLEL